jgi:glycosyltransferase 2 family protein
MLTLARLALVTTVTIGFGWLFLRQADLGAALATLARLPAWSLLAALAAVLVNVGLTALRWRCLLAAAGFRIEYQRLAAILVAGTAVNNLLPARAGDLVRLEALRRSDAVPAFAVAGTLFGERPLDGVVLSVFVLLGALLSGSGGPLLLVGIALSAGTALGIVLVAAAASRPAGTSRLLRAGTQLLPSRWAERVQGAGLRFVEGLGAFRTGRTLAAALASSAGAWLANLGLYVALGAGFGVDAGLGGYLALEGVGNLALAVPATAAGIGSFDYLTLSAADGLSADQGVATAYVLLLHAFVVVPVTLLGLAVLAQTLFRRGGRLLEETA